MIVFGDPQIRELRQLRDATGAGLMACKKALRVADGDVERALDYLRGKPFPRPEPAFPLNAADVKALRNKSGLGMMACKNALIQCEGDLLLAEGYLRYYDCAVAIRGDRKAWLLRKARAWADERRITPIAG